MLINSPVKLTKLLAPELQQLSLKVGQETQPFCIRKKRIGIQWDLCWGLLQYANGFESGRIFVSSERLQNNTLQGQV